MRITDIGSGFELCRCSVRSKSAFRSGYNCTTRYLGAQAGARAFSAKRAPVVAIFGPC